MRKCGILLPISCIPSRYGIGSFSKEAYRFIDFLYESGQTYWQILPLGPTGYGDSPYQSFSTFAGNPYYIDLDTLVEKGYLTKKDCDAYDFGGADDKIDYEKIYLARFKILYQAYENSDIQNDPEFREYIIKNSFWLEDYALYMAVKDSYEGKSFIEWEEDIKKREPDAMCAYKEKYARKIAYYQFLQYEFSLQWSRLKQYANKKHVGIIGDIPIYVAFDSADTWASPELFQLDSQLRPIAVAGCPPDAFSETGQLWGNPLYHWPFHKKTNYAWWMLRMAYSFERYDVVRIDHFRGFDEYYAIPYGSLTAENGKWEAGPGYELFNKMQETIGDKSVIAEDLGILTNSVFELVKKTGFPGMKILQFAFDSSEENMYLPHNYEKNSIVYTGTHDNDTTLGWYGKLNEHDKNFAKEYLNIQNDTSPPDIVWSFIRAALSSVSDVAIIPMQDYLELNENSRINMPSTLGDNWKWRMKSTDMSSYLAEKIKRMTKIYGR